MHIFNYEGQVTQLITSEIVSVVMKIYEYKGRQDVVISSHRNEANSLLEIAKIQSTGSSNGIEGISTTDKRLQELVIQKTKPRNRSEAEIAGYREVLNIIHENYQYINVNSNLILQLHRDLYSYSAGGGVFKNADNFILEIASNGTKKTRFIPVPAFQTKEFVQKMCNNFKKVSVYGKISEYDNFTESENIKQLLVIPMFILDFLCIHPFNDGNGRMSRLLTLLLLYQAGFFVGKYISIETLIEQSKDVYYDVLQTSSNGWHDNSNDYAPFVKYYLGIILRAYKEFDKRMEYVIVQKTSKSERIKKLIFQTSVPISKKQIMEFYPNISKVTIERTLIQLVKKGTIKKVGSGRNTKYCIIVL